MGIKIALWQQELINKLKESGYQVTVNREGKLTLMNFEGYKDLLLNLISIDDGLQPADISFLQQRCLNTDVQLVQLWEDLWLNRPEQVLSRIGSLLGGNTKKVHGRKTTVVAISQPEADHFLERFHLQGSAKSRFRFALENNGETVAVATFSAKRKMTRKVGAYYSVELIRFATTEGVTVQGGLSKLIKHFSGQIKPDDIMSYADLDWSQGKGYLRLGFEMAGQTAPSVIWLDTANMIRYFPHRLPAEIRSECTGVADLVYPLFAGTDYRDQISSISASDALENEVINKDDHVIHNFAAPINQSSDHHDADLEANFTEIARKMKSLHFAPVFNTGNKKYILYL